MHRDKKAGTIYTKYEQFLFLGAGIIDNFFLCLPAFPKLPATYT